ncbi:MAG TPA: EamA family transporter [Trichocoleus sp.]
MGQLDELPEETQSTESAEPREAEDVLKTVTQDLRSLQQDLVAQMSQDVRRLQAEKSRLLNDIEKLQNQQQMLQSQYEVTLSRHQLAQQQAWAKQLALALANHLHTALSQRLSQMVHTQQPSGVDLPQIPAAGGELEHTNRLLASLDDTVNRTFTSLRQDLSSYESALSQQLNRMHNLGQQGEAILEVLVGRITKQLQMEAARAKTAPGHESLTDRPITAPLESATPIDPNSAARFAHSAGIHHSSRTEMPPQEGTSLIPTAPAIAPEPAVVPPRSPAQPRHLSHFQTGLVMILFSTVALSLHNVVVGIVGNPSRLFGSFPIGGYITLNNFGSSLLILWMRMLVVVPLMAWLASTLYKPAWRDIKAFSQSKDRLLLGSVVGSGFFLFLSQVMIYIAIGQIGPGVAVTILFMYPLVTVPLAWYLFGDQPTRLRLLVMAAILTGVIFTAYPKLTATTGVSWNGVLTAALSGTAFACYLVTMQISFRKLHPVPVSLIQFITIFIFASISLIVLGVQVAPTDRLGLVVGGLILGGLTLIGYLLNNFGVRFMGAARASIIAASGPALTAFLAFLVTPGSRTALQGIQILGILIVTLGVTGLSFERLLQQNQSRPSKQANS